MGFVPGVGDITAGLMNAIVSGSGTVTGQIGQLVGNALGSDPHVNDPGAQEKFNDERSKLYAERDGAQYLGGYDPKAVLSDDPFDAMSHDQILGHVDAMGPAKLQDAAAAWRKLGELMHDSSVVFDSQIQRAIAERWEGAAGRSAAQGVGEYTKHSGDFTTAANLVGNKLDEAYTGVQQTVDTMPTKPGTSTFEHWVSKVPVAGLWKREQHESEEAHEQAIQIMKSVYMPVVHQADDQVPVLPAAFNPAAVAGPGESGGGGVGAGAGGRAGGGDGGSGAGSGLRPPTGIGVPTGPGQGRVSGSGAAAGDRWAASESNPLTDAPKSAASSQGLGPDPATDPVSLTTPAAASLPDGSGAYGGAGSGSAGTSGGSGGGSHGGVSGGLGGTSIMQPALGSPGTGTTGGGSGAGVGSAGRAGAPGMGGMAPHAGKGKGDDDKEHKTASYLVNVDNGNQLVGKMPKVAPPVIGG